jgi:hypothetical protein
MRRRRNGERESQLEPSHGLTSITAGNEECSPEALSSRLFI